MRALSHIVLVSAIMVFSIILTVFTIAKGTDYWIIPVFLCAAGACFFIHITEVMQPITRLYCYSAVLLFEIFYYILKIDNIYDAMPVVMLALAVLAMTGEKKFIALCVAVGVCGTIFRLSLYVIVDKASLGIGDLLHVTWHLLIVITVGFAISKMLKESEKAQIASGEHIAALEQENKIADDFLANVSHEIRTPINAVIGLTEVCLDLEENETVRTNLRSISAAGRRVGEQISDILDYSEIEMGRLAVNTEDYNISSVLNDLMSELKPYKPDGIELVIDVDPNLPAVMRGDPGKLKRILWHVIMNGLKYTREGGVYVCLSHIPQEYGLNLCIDIKDTGIGMTDTEKERVYERFYQSDSGRNRSSSGLGLGMSIVAGFVSILDGFITMDSKEGEGTEVHICIPQVVVVSTPCMSVSVSRSKKVIGTFLKFERFPHPDVREYYSAMMKNVISGLNVPVHRANDIDELKKINNDMHLTHLFVGETEYMTDPEYMETIAENMTLVIVCDDGFKALPGSRAKLLYKPFYAFPVMSILNADADAADIRQGRMYCRGVRVLTVDDEPMNLMVAKNLFKRYGMEVSLASSGEEAVSLCAENRYDLIFMDHMMPRMDGIETARRIRAGITGKGAQPVIVALTANAMSTAKEMFIGEGFDGFLSKPIEVAELERVLSKVLPVSLITYETEAYKKDIPDKEAHMPAEDDDMQMLRNAGIDPEKGMEYCLNDTELYKAVLEEFVNDSGEKVKELEEFFGKADWENYIIRIHSVKSSARMIGAISVSDRAKALESAAKENDIVYLNDIYPQFLKEYLELAEAIGSICKAGESNDK